MNDTKWPQGRFLPRQPSQERKESIFLQRHLTDAAPRQPRHFGRLGGASVERLARKLLVLGAASADSVTWPPAPIGWRSG